MIEHRLFPVLAAIALGFGAVGSAAEARPNIISILADDLGYGDLRCYNPQGKKPPPMGFTIAPLATLPS